MSKHNGVRRFLDVSTCHVTAKDCELLSYDSETHACGPQIASVVAHPYGYWLIANSEDMESTLREHGYSENLIAVMRKARALDCAWINLDADGTEHPDLNRHEW